MGTSVGNLAAPRLSELRVAIREDVISRRVGDDIVLIHLTSNQIFELNESASRLWELLEGGLSLSEIREQLGREYDIADNELELDLRETLDSLVQRNLIELRSGR